MEDELLIRSDNAMMKRLTLLGVLLYTMIAGQAWGATETFYMCHGGDGSSIQELCHGS